MQGYASYKKMTFGYLFTTIADKTECKSIYSTWQVIALT